MQGAPMISYAVNREDVVLWRALREIDGGHYAEIGLSGPQSRSMTRVLSEHGWTGHVVTADAERAEGWRTSRPRDTVETPHTPAALRAAVERAALPEGELHLLVVSGEGPALDAVLDESRFAALVPWVLVVTGSLSPESADLDLRLADAAYQMCLFDGVSRFYAPTARLELARPLSYPACVLDDFTDLRVHELQEENAALHRAVDDAREENLSELLRWRYAAVSAWATKAATRLPAASGEEVDHLRAALAAAQQDAAAVRQTLSWRVTTPLRAVRAVGRRP